MATNDQSLVVRQHERHECRIGAVVVCESSGPGEVHVSRTVGDGAGGVPTTLIDVSSGGVGLWSAVFFPKGCRLRLKVFGDDSLGAEGAAVRVQRVQMTDRKPTYYLGLSFAGDAPTNARVSAALNALAKASPAKAEGTARA